MSTHDLQRFVDAQDHDDTHDRALAELRRGRKTTHWMWFVFPQVEGLGRSETARRYAVAGLDEARAYLAHPLLGPRLRRASEVVLGLDVSAEEALGSIDAVKLRSSMTLFARADPDEPVFVDVLARFFEGHTDPATDERLG